MPEPSQPKNPSTSPAGPGAPNEREHERELEDRVGRRPDQEPDLVPAGTPVKRDLGLGKAGGSSGSELEDGEPLDEALIADRENARTSDIQDARDGVDNSDTVAIDPDAAGGKGPR